MSKKGLRTAVLVFVVFTVFVVYILQLMQMQIVDGAAYKSRLNEGSSRDQIIEAARGEILDRYGNPLAINVTGYNVVLDRAFLPEEAQNRIILDLTRLLTESGEGWIDNLPISMEQPFQFIEDGAAAAEKVYAKQVERLKNDIGVAQYTSVDDVLYNLVQAYRLEDFSPQDQRTIAGIRYEMVRRGFNISTRYTFAENIAIATVAKIKERGFALKGVDVAESSVRQYVSGSIAPHIIGYVGPIYAEQKAEIEQKNKELKKINKDYRLNETIGKAGAELQFEETLRGSYGIRRITMNAQGDVIDAKTVTEPVPGNTLVLTIDSNMQQVAQDAMGKEIRYLQQNAPPGEGREADSGAVAVIHCKTGEVLAAATYPTYDMDTFKYDYASLLADERHPLTNRAYYGTYAAGSCYKPAVAVAGLATNGITPTTIYNCSRVYTRFDDYRPTCLSAHGNLTVLDALKHSCNIFFYELGYNVGIDTMNRFSAQLGLGQPTGIELPEKIGELSSPATKEQHEPGVPWTEGDIVQSAIGQLYNNFTPLQMANYTATIGNRGKRMELHMVKSIENYNLDGSVMVSEPKVAQVVDAPREVFDTVTEGMVRASRPGGTSGNYIGNYPIDIASKTGTPQTKRYPNSVFIAFAPAADPEIAVAVVIEKGWHGYTGAPVARAIFDQYFYSNNEQVAPIGYGVLLP